MSSIQLYGWDATNEVWVKVSVDADGKLHLSDDDPFEITQTTPEDLRHVPHGYDYTNLVYRAIAVNTSGKQLVEHVNTKIIDADGDTKVDVEESADEDIVRMDVAGVESFHLSAAGMLTMVKQSAARAYLLGAATGQLIPDNIWTHVKLASETYDIQNEFNSSVVSGTADATEANKLHDDDGGFTSALVGATVRNTTDTTYTTVSGFVDSGELDLTDDIMADGESYEIYFCRFTATEAGKYVVTANLGIQVVDATRGELYIRINGVNSHRVAICGSYTTWVYCMGGSVYDLAASDYIDLIAKHNIGGNGYIYGDTWATFLSVVKVT